MKYKFITQMKNIAENLQRLLQGHTYGEIVTELLRAAQESGKFDPLKRNEILHKHWFAFKCRYVDDALNAVLDYADVILEDSILTDDECISIRYMRAYLHIDENDFNKHHKEARVQQIIISQLRKLYADNQIDRQEAIMQSEMQGLFGLSSEQYSRYVDLVKNEAIEKGADKQQLIRNI